MAFKSRRQSRYLYLKDHHFTTYESKELSRLPKQTPAVQLLIADRVARWDRFVRIAERRLDKGLWTKEMLPDKWKSNLQRSYGRNHWKVQFGPTGKQQPMPKGSPNPWAMYRDYEKRVGGRDTKGYVSPWELKQIKSGKTLLDKGLLFVQKRKKTGKTGKVDDPVTRDWIHQLDEKIARSRGKVKARLVGQRKRLSDSLG